MIRKQLYIEARQERTLKRLARARGTTEAEVMRAAIDALGERNAALPPSEQAWRQALGLMKQLAAMGPLPGGERRESREDLYRERLDRYGRHSD